MFRVCIILIFSLLSKNILAALDTEQQSVSPRAVAISIAGTGFVADQEAEHRLRTLIGSAISKGIVDKFLIYAYKQNGGFSGCLQANPSVAIDKFQSMVATLESLHYNHNTTMYSMTPIQTCSELVTIYKDDKSVQCDDTQTIPLESMQAELEKSGISVYSAKKISDGFAHPAACGADTGMLNSYVIKTSDLDLAIQLGFRLWTGPAENPDQ